MPKFYLELLKQDLSNSVMNNFIFTKMDKGSILIKESIYLTIYLAFQVKYANQRNINM